MKNVKVNLSSEPVVSKSVDLPEVKEICCVFGECKDCKNNPNENYPILFIHGHAISKENRPEMSHTAFTKIQLLMEEEGFDIVCYKKELEDCVEEREKGWWSVSFEYYINIDRNEVIVG